MSQFIEIASTVQEQQVNAVKQSQEAFLKLVESLSDNAPAAEDVEVPEQVQEAFKPAVEFFGTADQVQAYLGEATKTWTKIGQDFQNAVVALVTSRA